MYHIMNTALIKDQWPNGVNIFLSQNNYEPENRTGDSGKNSQVLSLKDHRVAQIF
jgi:hypothetical protein